MQIVWRCLFRSVGRKLEVGSESSYNVDRVLLFSSGDTTPGTPPSSRGSGVALSTLAEDSDDEGMEEGKNQVEEGKL